MLHRSCLHQIPPAGSHLTKTNTESTTARQYYPFSHLRVGQYYSSLTVDRRSKSLRTVKKTCNRDHEVHQCKYLLEPGGLWNGRETDRENQFTFACLVALMAAAPLRDVRRSTNQIFDASKAVPENVFDGVGAGVDDYKLYTGDGSCETGWPAMSQWVSFQNM